MHSVTLYNKLPLVLNINNINEQYRSSVIHSNALRNTLQQASISIKY